MDIYITTIVNSQESCQVVGIFDSEEAAKNCKSELMKSGYFGAIEIHKEAINLPTNNCNCEYWQHKPYN